MKILLKSKNQPTLIVELSKTKKEIVVTTIDLTGCLKLLPAISSGGNVISLLKKNGWKLSAKSAGVVISI